MQQQESGQVVNELDTHIADLQSQLHLASLQHEEMQYQLTQVRGPLLSEPLHAGAHACSGCSARLRCHLASLQHEEMQYQLTQVRDGAIRVLVVQASARARVCSGCCAWFRERIGFCHLVNQQHKEMQYQLMQVREGPGPSFSGPWQGR